MYNKANYWRKTIDYTNILLDNFIWQFGTKFWKTPLTVSCVLRTNKKTVLFYRKRNLKNEIEKSIIDDIFIFYTRKKKNVKN